MIDDKSVLIAVASHVELRHALGECYRLAHVDDLCNQELSGKSNAFYSELSCFYDLWKQGFGGADYFGLVHYRRRFCGFDNALYPIIPAGLMGGFLDYSAQPGLEERGDWLIGLKASLRSFAIRYLEITRHEVIRLLGDADILLPKATGLFPSVRRQYERCHVASDLLEMRAVIEQMQPDSLGYFDMAFSRRSAHLFNMFICSSGLAGEYAEWLFPLLIELERRLPLKARDQYQCRVPAFMAERLLNVFVLSHSLKVVELPVVIDLAYD